MNTDLAFIVNSAKLQHWEVDELTGDLLDDDANYPDQVISRRNNYRRRLQLIVGEEEPPRKRRRAQDNNQDEDDIDDSSVEDDRGILQPGVVRPADTHFQAISQEHVLQDAQYFFSDRWTREQFTMENCIEAVDRAESVWCIRPEGEGQEHPMTIACRRFGIDWDGVSWPIPREKINLQQLDKAYETEFMALVEIIYRSYQAGNLQNDSFKERVERVQSAIYYAYQVMRNISFIQQSYHANCGLANDVSVFRFKPFNQNLMDPYHELLHYCTSKIQECGYVRFRNEYFYERIFNDKGQFVHSYKCAKTVEQFVYEVAPKYSNFDLWSTVAERGVADGVIKYLKNRVEAEIPVLRKDRYIMSFNNGIYFIKEDYFAPYDTESFSNKIMASVYHPLNFDYHPELKSVDFLGNADDTGPRHPGTADDIPTPYFDSILKDQEMTYTTRIWFYVFFGRLFYWLRDCDNWQVAPINHGVAGTGKSTLCELISRIYDVDDTGVLPNKAEKTFGLESLVDMLTILSPEVNQDFGVDRADLQSMITGERVQIRRKGKPAITIDWRAPLMLAGNETPEWKDKQGQMARRLIIFKYLKVIKKVDSRLLKKLESEIPQVVLKCNRFYRAALTYVGESSVWEKLPEYFRASRKKFQSEMSAIHGFFNSDEVQIVLDDNGKPDKNIYISTSALRDAYIQWKKDNEIRDNDRWSVELYSKALQDVGLKPPDTKRVVCSYPRDAEHASHKVIVYGMDKRSEIERLEMTGFNG